MDANLYFPRSVFRRKWPTPAAVDHVLEGLRKAGFE